MRKALFLLLTGMVLGGCLTSEDNRVSSGFITNTPGNDAPVISGNPDPAVMINDLYEFEPAAQDPDGDTLTFAIQNKPVWASFDSATGRLFGQPTLGNIGMYENIVVSVSDGEKTDTLPAFSVTVTDVALGSVTLNWAPPTENEDGSPLTDLAGYKIYYGTSSRVYNREIVIENAAITSYIVDQLLPDTYYFAGTSFNNSGIESAYSQEATRSVN